MAKLLSHSRYSKTTLENGLRIVTEFHSQSKSFSCGAWVTRGTRDEPEGLEGISHFLEHLVFKGTQQRSAFEIAAALENLGGDLNAYTTKEHTCYHGLVLREDAKIALDVILDLMSGMKLKAKDFELEKNVILQEMAASNENHEEMVFETFFEKAYEGHPLGRKILGTEKSISDITRKSVENYYLHNYLPHNMVISASGSLPHKEVVRLVKKFTSRIPHWKSDYKPKEKDQRTIPEWKKFRECIARPTEMIHVLIGLPVPSFKDKSRFESFVLNAYLGGGMTSSLFQNVRERRGLVYNIQSTLNTHEDCGSVLVYASTEKSNVKEVVNIIVDELKRLKRQGIRKEFVEQFRKQIAGQILLGSDDMENRMTSLGINEMVFGEYRSVEQVIKDVKSVTEKSMKKYISTHLDFKNLSGLLVGSDALEFQDWWNDVFAKIER